MDWFFADPLLANACWVCVVLGAGVLTLAIRDARYSDTRVMRRIGVAFVATGVVLGVANIAFLLQPLPSVR